MELSLVGPDGGIVKPVEVSPIAFGRDFNEALVHQVIVAMLAGRRSGTKGQKNRSAVSGGGAKPWKQKGTGRARAGTIRSPLWRSGGMTFASAENRDFSQKVNKKMYKGAMRAIMSELLRQDRIKVLEAFSLTQPKTKLLLTELKKLGVEHALIILEHWDPTVYLAARNVPGIDIREARNVDPVALVKHPNVVMTVGAIRKIEEVLG